MEIKKRLPISTTLFVFVPLVILNIALYILTNNWVMQSKEDEIDTIAQISSDQLTEIMNFHWKELERQVKIFEAQLEQGQSFSSLLPQAYDSVTFSDPDSAVYLILDNWGQVFAASDQVWSKDVLLTGEELSRLRKGEWVLTSLLERPYAQEPFILWCLPIADASANILGYFARVSYVRDLQFLSAPIRIGGTGYGYVADHRGIIISHPDANRINTMTENQSLRDLLNLSDEAINQSPKSSVYVYRNSAKFMSFRLLDHSQWFLVFNQTLDEISIPVYRVLVASLMVFLVMVFLGIFLSIYLSNLIVQPIQNMLEVVNAIGRGDFSVRCAIYGNDELSALAERMNTMIRQLSDANSSILKSKNDLSLSEERYRNALEGAQDVIYDWDLQHNELFVSERFRTVFPVDYSPSGDLLDFFRRHCLSDDFLVLETEFEDHLRNIKDVFKVEIRLRNGPDLFWMLLRGKILRGLNGEALRMSGSMTNISERKIREERIQKMAFFDSLTGLPNRQACLENSPPLLQYYDKEGFISGLALLDIRNLRQINDSLGHDAGDQVLEVVAERLSFFCQAHPGYSGKPGIPYRFGGDEFILLFPAFLSQEELLQYVALVFEKISNAFSLGEKLIYVHLNLGIALFPQQGSDIHELLRKADIALYNNRLSGKKPYEIYTDEMTAYLQKQITLEEALRLALKEQSWALHYQALVDMASLKIRGFEVLLRMKDSQGIPINPEDCIPIAEQTGIIHDLGLEIFRKTCLQASQWKAQGKSFSYLSVNVSPVQFTALNFVPSLILIAQNLKCKPEWIQLEITENALFSSFTEVIESLGDLHRAGFRIALDDFGIGYSSLGYLKSLPLDCIKIDRSFVKNLESSERNDIISQGIISIARELKFEVIVEGIENRQHFEKFRAKGCTIAQGFLFGQAEEAEQAERFFDARPELVDLN